MMGVRGRKLRFMAVDNKMMVLYSVYGIEWRRDWLVKTVLLLDKSSERLQAKYLMRANTT
jgi:hypothetical protein